LLPPSPHLDELDHDIQNGHVNDHANVGHAEGNAEKVEGDANVEGNVGHARGMLAMLRGMILMWMLKRKRPPDVQKRQLPDVQKRRLL